MSAIIWMILSTFVVKYGIGLVCITGALAFAWFSPVFKKTALWVASVIAIGMIVFTVGVHDGVKFEKTKWDAAIARVDKQVGNAVSGAKSDVANGVRDPWDTDK